MIFAMLAEGAGRGSKTLFLWLPPSGSSIVSMPQKACSALLRGFESRTVTGSQDFVILFYNADNLRRTGDG